MPRGPTVYSLPPGTTPQVPGDTIASATFNAAMDDIANTFNTPQPIEYGGTGGTDAPTARDALGLKIGTDIPSNAQLAAVDAKIQPPGGYIFGLRLTNNGTDANNDIDIAVGEAASDGTPPVLMTLATALVKRIDATFTVGTNQGMRDTGSVSNNTWYMFLIRRPDTGVVDVLASLSSTAPTMPANYTQKKLIGQFIRASNVNGTPSWYGPVWARSRTWYAAKTDTASTSSATWADTGLSVIASALSADSSIRVEAYLNGIGGAAATQNLQLRLVRDSTLVSPIGDAAGSRVRVSTELVSSNNIGGAATMNTTLVAIDTPGDTAQHTYKVQWQVSGGTAYLNRSVNDTDSSAYSRTASVIMATEVNRQ